MMVEFYYMFGLLNKMKEIFHSKMYLFHGIYKENTQWMKIKN
jgi:hypothetical protein